MLIELVDEPDEEAEAQFRPLSAKDKVLLQKSARRQAQQELMEDELKKARVAYFNQISDGRG